MRRGARLHRILVAHPGARPAVAGATTRGNAEFTRIDKVYSDCDSALCSQLSFCGLARLRLRSGPGRCSQPRPSAAAGPVAGRSRASDCEHRRRRLNPRHVRARLQGPALALGLDGDAGDADAAGRGALALDGSLAPPQRQLEVLSPRAVGLAAVAPVPILQPRGQCRQRPDGRSDVGGEVRPQPEVRPRPD